MGIYLIGLKWSLVISRKSQEASVFNFDQNEKYFNKRERSDALCGCIVLVMLWVRFQIRIFASERFGIDHESNILKVSDSGLAINLGFGQQ